MIKICIIGNTGVGKSALKNMWAHGNNKNFNYIKKFEFTSLEKADYVFLVFDVTNLQSYRDNILWYNLIRETNNVPICLIGNKIDAKKRKVTAKMINFHRDHTLTYFEMSAKSHYQFEKPLEWAIGGGKFMSHGTVVSAY